MGVLARPVAALRAGPFAHRGFRRYALGRGVSLLGDGIEPVALAFAVLARFPGSRGLSLVLASWSTALVVFTLVGGVLADRLQRRTVIVGADVLSAVSMGAFALVCATDTGGLGLLVVIAFVAGTAVAASGPATFSFMPALVPAEDLQSGNAVISLLRSTGFIAGPPLAAALIAWQSPPFALAVDAASFAFSALMVALIHVPRTAREDHESFLHELRVGFGEFRARSWVWAVTLCYMVFLAFGDAAVLALGPVVADTSFDGAASYAVVMLALGLGSLVGGLLVLRLRVRHLLWTGALLMLLNLPMPFAWAVPLPLGLIALAGFVGGIGWESMIVTYQTSMQQHIPPHVISRVLSWDWLGSFLAAPLGFALLGSLATRFGLGPTLTVCGVVSGTALLVAAWIPSVRSLTVPEPVEAASGVG